MSKRAELRVVWSKQSSDFKIHHDRQVADGHFMYSFLCAGAEGVTRSSDSVEKVMSTFRKELERRGFDPNTFQISVRRKKDGSTTTVHRKKDVATMTADEWNSLHPVGTPVRYWPVLPSREGEGVDTVTRSEAWTETWRAKCPIVLVKGIAGGVLLSHLEVSR